MYITIYIYNIYYTQTQHSYINMVNVHKGNIFNVLACGTCYEVNENTGLKNAYYIIYYLLM